MSSPGRLIGGRYRLVRKIAEGGMGEVYEAEHNLSKKAVALKILFPHIGKDEAARQRFLREVSAPAQIGHDNIVEVLDAGFDIEDGSLFVAMELLKGEPLRERLARGGFSLDLLLDWFERILDPLAAAHDKGIVHRDLKPENIFMTLRRDGTEVIKVLDFGIARDLDSSQGNVTHTGIAMGTPHYMAPEQAMSARSVSAAADVWALGVILYEALAGRPPFDGETPSAIVVLACTQAHTPLTQLAPQVPAPLAAFVDRCLAKEPSGRPPDCGAMLAELRSVRQQIGSIPGVAAAAAGMAAMSSALGGGSQPARNAYTPAPHGSADAAPGAYTPPPAYGSAGAAPGAYTPPPAYGTMPLGEMSPNRPAPAPRSSGGLGLLLVAVVLLGGATVIGVGLLVGAVLLRDGALGGAGDPQHATVRIVTDVPAGELFVDDASRGPVVPHQEFRIEPGPHAIELREGGRSIASTTFTAIAGQRQTVTLNRSRLASAPVPQVQPVRVPSNVQTQSGRFEPTDPSRPGGEYVDTYVFEWTAGSRMRVELDSDSVDTVLIVTSPSGATEENDDRPGGGLNSGLTIFVHESGPWQVECTTWSSYATGSYTLRVHEL